MSKRSLFVHFSQACSIWSLFWHFCEHLLCDAKVFGAKLSAVDKVAFTGNFYQVFSFQRQSTNLVSPPSFIWLDFWLRRIQLQAIWLDSDCTEMQRTISLFLCTLYLECGGTIYSRFELLNSLCWPLFYFRPKDSKAQASILIVLLQESSQMKLFVSV